jgi:hypothetical protein
LVTNDVDQRAVAAAVANIAALGSHAVRLKIEPPCLLEIGTAPIRRRRPTDAIRA